MLDGRQFVSVEERGCAGDRGQRTFRRGASEQSCGDRGLGGCCADCGRGLLVDVVGVDVRDCPMTIWRVFGVGEIVIASNNPR